MPYKMSKLYGSLWNLQDIHAADYNLKLDLKPKFVLLKSNDHDTKFVRNIAVSVLIAGWGYKRNLYSPNGDFHLSGRRGLY